MKGTFKSLILVFVLVLAFVGTGAGEEKQVGQIEKKYPPYPDVWDFKVLTKEEVSKGIWTTRPAKLPDGDYVFIKLQEEGKGKQSKIKVVGCVTMFGRSELPIEECKKIYKNVSLCRKTISIALIHHIFLIPTPSFVQNYKPTPLCLQIQSQ